jgi:hypothetical protein
MKETASSNLLRVGYFTPRNGEEIAARANAPIVTDLFFESSGQKIFFVQPRKKELQNGTTVCRNGTRRRVDVCL